MPNDSLRVAGASAMLGQMVVPRSGKANEALTNYDRDRLIGRLVVSYCSAVTGDGWGLIVDR